MPEAETTAPLYALELLGDATIVALRLGGAIASIRAAKDYRAEIGDPVSVHIPTEACHLFHADTGERLG